MRYNCICHLDPKKNILLQSTTARAIIVHGLYVYDSNYDYMQFKINERYDNLFVSTITFWEIIRRTRDIIVPHQPVLTQSV